MNLHATTLSEQNPIELTFKSERLLFRPLCDIDQALAIELWTDPEVTQYVGGTATETELRENHRKYMRRCARGVIGIWTLTRLDNNEQIGTAILLPMPEELDDTDWDLVVGDDLPDAQIEVGYILKKSAWGKGYATEACKKLVAFGFENSTLDEIVASIDYNNEASRNVLLKSGLQEAGEELSYGEICPFFRISRKLWMEDQNVD